ncbi:MAG TPA: hypothetical protein VIV57_07670 [Anaeromyxobacter sp.]
MTVGYVDESLTGFASPVHVACGAGRVFVADDTGPSGVQANAVRIIW